MKVNPVGGRAMAFSAPLAYSFADRLTALGVKPADIMIWDRDDTSLKNQRLQN